MKMILEKVIFGGNAVVVKLTFAVLSVELVERV